MQKAICNQHEQAAIHRSMFLQKTAEKENSSIAESTMPAAGYRSLPVSPGVKYLICSGLAVAKERISMRMVLLSL